MRTIKFRGKRVDNGKWAYGGFGYIPKEDDYAPTIIATQFFEQHEEDEHVICIEVIPDTIGQYSGLNAYNNKEVYEGDILQSTIDQSLLDWLVVFENGSFGIRNIGIDGDTHGFYPVTGEYFFRDREHVGDLYSNPELLNQTP